MICFLCEFQTLEMFEFLVMCECVVVVFGAR